MSRLHPRDRHCWWPLRTGLVLLTVLASGPVAHAVSSSPFRELGFAAALTAAASEGKPVLVDFSTVWCASCRELDERVFTRSEVADAASAYVAVRVDAEKGEGPDLASRYRIVAYPTLLFLTPDGTEIDRLVGETDAGAVRTALEEFHRHRGTLGDLEDRLAMAGRKAPLSLLYDVGVRRAMRGDRVAAEKLLLHVVKRDVAGEGGLAPKALYALAVWLYQPAADHGRVVALLQRLREDHPGTDPARDALLPLARSQIALGRADHARATLDLLLERSEPAWLDYAWFCLRERWGMPRGIEVATLGLKAHGTDARLWSTLGELYWALGDGARARAAMEKAVEHGPRNDYYRARLTEMKAKPGVSPKEGGK